MSNTMSNGVVTSRFLRATWRNFQLQQFHEKSISEDISVPRNSCVPLDTCSARLSFWTSREPLEDKTNWRPEKLAALGMLLRYSWNLTIACFPRSPEQKEAVNGYTEWNMSIWASSPQHSVDLETLEIVFDNFCDPRTIGTQSPRHSLWFWKYWKSAF